ncbi:MAG: AAA family ATPase [Leptospiraceae bacterium]|nr:AAA family ATPase [Leptospiraceae bacterium]
MEKIGEFLLLEKIAETKKSAIYRAKKSSDTQKVVLKILKREFNSAVEIARIKQESSLVENLSINGIILSKGILISENTVALILEDTGGTSLKQFLNQYSVNYMDFFPIAISLANTLALIHSNNIIHKDIKPHNIIVDHISGEIQNARITDFGISTIINEKIAEIYETSTIEGTLPYISPEQTGRMNLNVDYRTDLYSLGITFFEILTGKLPFESRDPLELIHQHMAKEAPKVHEINKSIPEVLSSIITKLIAKSPEDRYQSAYGLKNELEYCYTEIKKSGKSFSFQPGFMDICDRFIIPQKLFGRENEVEKLLNSFESVTFGKTKIVLVSGDPGIGKSRLVNEIHKPLIKHKGYFITGKYDQIRREVPFSSIIQSFQTLLKQILAESEERISYWREELKLALGDNGKVISSVIPELELILGKQQEISELSPEESMNRFYYTFLNFVKVFTKRDHPITLFLDDLQWADLPSLNLLKIILQDRKLNHLLIIFAFRDGEVGESHPFKILISELEKMNREIDSIHLDSLKINDVENFIVHLIGNQQTKSRVISNILYEKTRGNPFFLNQFTKRLYEEKIIEFTVGKGWSCDFERIQSLEVTDNVVELMAKKIASLSPTSMKLLELASCIGNRFTLEQLSLVNETSIEETLFILNETLQEGFVTFSKDYYKFLHDRIQEAAYSLITDEEKILYHRKIGELTLKDSIGEKIFENVFYIADQFNKAIPSFLEEDEKLKLIELNLLAGKKALSSAAYFSAFHYFKTCLQVIKSFPDFWNEKYSLTLSIYTYTAESAYLCLKYDEMEVYSDEALSKTQSMIDRISIYEIKIKTFIARYDLKNAVEEGLRVLKELGIRFPKKPNPGHAVLSLLSAKIKLLIRNDNILDLPKLEDANTLAAIRIISTINSATYFAAPDLLPLLLLKVVNLSLSKGNSRFSAYNFVGFGLILCSLEFFLYGNKIGKLAIELVEKQNQKEEKPRVYFVYNTFVRPWVEPVSNCLDPLLNAYQNAISVGDIEFASHSALVYGYYSYLSGLDLEEVLSRVRLCVDASQNLKQETDLNVLNMYKQITMTLTERDSFHHNLSGSSFEPKELFKVNESEIDKTSLFHFNFLSLILSYMMKDFETAIIHAEKNALNKEGALSVYMLPVNYFYDSLVRLALYKKGDLNSKLKSKYLKIVKSNLAILSKWEKYCSENLENKVLIIKAELASIDNDFSKAVFLYEKAILKSKVNGFTNEEGIVSELCGNFYQTNGLKEVSRLYFSQARIAFNKWGASLIVARLDKSNPTLTRKTDIEISEIISTSDTSLNLSTKTRGLDVSTILKFSHVLSSETDLKNLLGKIVSMSMENAGAEKGVLILEKKGKLYVEASINSSNKIVKEESIPVFEFSELSEKIVNYVWKTKEGVVLANASNEGLFIKDPYVQANKIKSVLCSPILHKKRLSGILYLENNLTTNAFINERLELLSILSTQAAISIENARLISERESSAKLAKEMEITARIQKSLIPEVPYCEGYEISSFMQAAESVGGDYYDVINTKDKDWFIIGDVSGHGILSGLIMMMVQTSIHILLSNDTSFTPAKLLLTLLNGIEENIRKISRHEYKYMTVTFLSFNKEGEFSFAGQHQDLIIYRKNTNSIEKIQTEGIWIGVGSMTDHKEDLIKDKTFKMESGDILVLYTDGITEGENSDLEMLGTEGLCKLIFHNSTKTVSQIKDEILKITKEYKCNDDITFLVIQKK